MYSKNQRPELQYDTRAACYPIKEQGKQQVAQIPSSQRDVLKSVRTIKSPMFFSNHDEKTSSPSENTDTEEPGSPRADAKSKTAGAVVDNAAVNEKVIATNSPEVESAQNVTSDAKSIHVRPTSYKRTL